MRLGAPVYHWTTGEEWALEHVKRGYGAAYWPLPVDAPRERENEFCEAAARHDLVIAEVGVWNNLLDPDPERAAQNVRYCVARMRQAERVGARCCVNISGSLGSQWDGPHRDNLTRATFERVVALTRRMIDEAGLEKCRYALEPMPWMYPTGEDDMRALIEKVDRAAFGVHVDMVNMISGADKIYRTGELTRAYFKAFGSKICSVHVKDIAISGELTTHLSEVPAGEGEFDHETLLRACAALGDVPVMAEHLPDEADYDRAIAHLRGVAARAGLSFDKAR